MNARTNRRAWVRRETVWLVGAAGGVLGVSVAMGTISTTVRDFFLAGTQPLTITDPIADSTDCYTCHAGYDQVKEPGRPWAASMMGQAARDPFFFAGLAIANQDAAFAGEYCIRCHSPGGWLSGHSADPTGAQLTSVDKQGVSCNFCHRMVDPVYKAGVSPAEDQAVLAALSAIPPNPHTANFVVDPQDRRRGPLQLSQSFFFHQWLQSPFHTTSNMCATCHDLSNPLYTKQSDGTYALNALDTPHPTGSKFDMFPVERTYSEWANSTFAQGPVNVNGRFGGTLAAVSSCQDCHMPQATGKSATQGPTRTDLPQHHFNGGNTWVLSAIRSLYSDSDTLLSQSTVDDANARATAMLQNAADLALSVGPGGAGPLVKARVTNWTGHKLPTGYTEGRRMWVNVQFLNASNAIVAERGAYNSTTGALTTSDTKVYEARLGLDAAASAASGVPAGESFHFVLNNIWILDNRIPPMGFTNAAFAAVQAQPQNYAYADGQNWDDTSFVAPAGATSAKVTLYYQTVTKEYAEFLRDKNTTDGTGLTAYNAWSTFGKASPVAMRSATIAIPTNLCYANCDGSTASPVLSAADFVCFLGKFRSGDAYANCDGSTTSPVLSAADFVCFLNKFRAGCP
jgi:hypothetical protein